MDVLLIEDNPGDVRLLKEMLAEVPNPPVAITHADRLGTGLAALKHGRFEAILLDLSLPDSDGLDTLLRVHDAAKGIPIVVLTGIDDDALGLQLVQRGAQDYLVKGQVTPSLLTRALRYAIERKRIEDQLRDKTALLESVLDTIPDGVVAADGFGRFVLWNPAAVNIIGAGPESITPDDWSTHYALRLPDAATPYPTEDLPLMKAMRGESVNDELVLVAPPGGNVWLSVNARPLLDRDGHVIGGVAAFRDITLKKQALEALHESESRYRSLVDTAGSIILVLAADHTIVEWNAEAERVYGQRREAVLGRNYFKLFVPETLWAELEAEIGAVLRGKETRSFESRISTADGTERVVSWNINRLVDSQGRPVSVIAVGQDMTEHHRADDELRAREARIRLILESTDEGIYGIDLDGLCTFINSAACRMLGYPPADVIGQHMHTLIHHHRGDGSPYAEAECPVLRFQQDGYHADDEILWRRDGTSFPAEFSAYPILDQGVMCGSVIAFMDITARKLVEERLRATLDRVRMLSRRVDAVREEERMRIARELHDQLGVGLTCLKIDLVQLRTLLEGQVHAERRTAVDEKIARMLQFIGTTIKDVQRLVAELRPAVLDDLGLVAAVQWLTQDFEQRTGIASRCHVSHEDLRLAPERATVLFRICQEALTNVMRHARADTVTVSLSAGGGEVVLSINDNGVGIQPDKLADARSFGLTGMHERARLFGGDVRIVGGPGKGTTITVRLPMTEST